MKSGSFFGFGSRAGLLIRGVWGVKGSDLFVVWLDVSLGPPVFGNSALTRKLSAGCGDSNGISDKDVEFTDACCAGCTTGYRGFMSWWLRRVLHLVSVITQQGWGCWSLVLIRPGFRLDCHRPCTKLVAGERRWWCFSSMISGELPYCQSDVASIHQSGRRWCWFVC